MTVADTLFSTSLFFTDSGGGKRSELSGRFENPIRMTNHKWGHKLGSFSVEAIIVPSYDSLIYRFNKIMVERRLDVS